MNPTLKYALTRTMYAISIGGSVLSIVASVRKIMDLDDAERLRRRISKGGSTPFWDKFFADKKD